MKKTKKFLAVVAAMAMALAPTCVYADTPAASGEGASTGGLEGAVVQNCVDYTVPTVTAESFKFLLDPQELIANTDGESLDGTSVVTEAGVTVYFQNGDNYAASSNALEVTNKGTAEITVSASATMSLDATGASIKVVTDSAAVASGSALNLRIHLDQVTGGSASASLATDSSVPTKSALNLSVTAAGADADQFEVTKVAGEYKYEPKADAASGDSVAFVFRGECNDNSAADWTRVKGMTAQFKVVWNVSAAGGNKVTKSNPEIAWSDRTSALSFTLDLASFSASSINDVGIYSGGKVYDATGSWGAKGVMGTLIKISGATVTIDSSVSQFIKSGDTIYIRFDNANNDDVGLIKVK